MSPTPVRRSMGLSTGAVLLVLGSALFACSADDGNLDGDSAPDAGTSAGGTFASGPGGVGGAGALPDASATDGERAGGGEGGAMGQAGQGGMSTLPDAAAAPVCEVGGACGGEETCTQACANGGSARCTCVAGRLFCGRCMRMDDDDDDPNACPAAPQAQACDADRQPFCQYSGEETGRGTCVCSSGKLFCPELPAPEGTPDCPQNPNLKPCMSEGGLCADDDETCLCSRIGEGETRIWICR